MDTPNEGEFENKMEYRKSMLTKRFSKAVGNINLDDLINVCSKKLEKDPKNIKALYIRANTYLKKGLFFDSLEDCNKLIQIDNEYAGAFYIRGCAYEKIEEIDKAIDDYSKVLELDSNHVNAVFARGACRNKKGEFQKAIEDYNEALKKDEKRQAINMKKLLDKRRSKHNFKGQDLENCQNMLPEKGEDYIRESEHERALN